MIFRVLQEEASTLWEKTKFIVSTASTAAKLSPKLDRIHLPRFGKDFEVSLLGDNPSIRDAGIDYLVLDEAGAMHELDVLGALLCCASNVLLVGDHHQLPPAVSLHFKGHDDYRRSTMQRLIEGEKNSDRFDFFQLVQQYRMPPLLCRLVSDLYYGGTLKTAPEKERENNPHTILKRTWVWGEEEIENASYYNFPEAQEVLATARSLLKKGAKIEAVVVITFYAAQRALIEKLARQDPDPELKKLHVATVDSMQGQERDHVILSCVRTKEPGFTKNKNRLNVAVSRAKLSLTIIVNKNLKNRTHWRNVLEKVKNLNASR